MDLGSRIFTLLKSISTDQLDQFDKMLRESKQHIYDELEKWEKSHGITPEEPWQQPDPNKRQKTSNRSEQTSTGGHYQGQSSERRNGQSYPEEFLKDLATFGLTPPVSIEAVKKARNREIKMYHPDKFANDPAKQETSKEILQLINGAFARLQKHPLMKN